MKRFLFSTLLVALIAGATYSCAGKAAKENTTEQKEVVATVYTCPMHPEVISDKPGSCPKCHMALVVKK